MTIDSGSGLKMSAGVFIALHAKTMNHFTDYVVVSLMFSRTEYFRSLILNHLTAAASSLEFCVNYFTDRRLARHKNMGSGK